MITDTKTRRSRSGMFHRPDDARKAFDSTLSALKMDYIDLFLIHWPLPTLYDGDYVSTWKVLEESQRDGRARSIGVSNFQVAHLQRLADEASVVPAVNQIEAHPYFGNEEVRAYGREHNILTEAWSPIAQGKVLDAPTVVDIAGEVGRTPAQVVLRWHPGGRARTRKPSPTYLADLRIGRNA
ncbi:aldo/keto reductase [Micromonospora sp. DT4]|uniref:aldo/keto reductase n=1 Tax=Micromonospora sp. DT4 TaxID=3393438 RepID=UPI003CF8463C